MTTLGRAYIEIVADGSGFSRSLREQVGTNLDRDMAQLGHEGGQSFVGGFEQGITDAAPQAERAGDELGKRTSKRVGISGEAAGKEFTSGVSKGVKATEADVDAAWNRVGTRLNNRTKQIGGNAGKSLADNFGKEVEKIEKKLDGPINAVQGKLNAFAGFVGKWGSIIALGGYGVTILGESLLALLPILLNVGASMVRLSGIALGIPAALGPVGLAMLSVALAVSGFQKAITAVDDAAFQKATVNMGAGAKQLAATLRDLMPQFRSVQQAAQNAFSEAVVGNVRAIAASVVGVLRPGVATLAGDFGRAADQAGLFIASAHGVSLLQGWFNTADIGMQSLTRGLGPLMTGLTNLARVTKPIIDGLVAGVGNVEASFGNWLTRISASGQAFNWLQTAVVGFQNLAQIALNIVNIFRALWENVGGGAKDLLATLALLTGSLSRFLLSAQGQNALTDFFSIVNASGSTVHDLLIAIGEAFVAIARPAAEVATAIGPGLTALVRALGDALAALGPALVPLFAALSAAVIQIAPQLPAIATSFANIVIAALPLVPVLANLATSLGQDLAAGLQRAVPAVSDLVSVLTPLLSFMAAHTSTVWALVAAFVALRVGMLGLNAVAAGLEIAEKLQKIPAAIALVQGAFQTLAGGAMAAYDAALALSATATVALSDAMIAFSGTALGAFVVGVGEATAAMIGLDIAMDANPIGVVALGILALVAAIAALVVGVIELVKHWQQVIDFFKAFPGYLTAAYQAVIGFAQAIPAALSNAWDAVVGFLAGLPGQIGSFFAGIGSSLLAFVSSLVGMVGQAITTAWGAALTFLESLPATLGTLFLDALKAAAFAVGAGIALIVGTFILLPIQMVQILIEWIPKILVFFWNLPGQILSAIVGLTASMIGFFTDLWARTVAIVSQWTIEIVQFMIDLPGRMLGAIVRLIADMIGFFTNLWHSTNAVVWSFLAELVQFWLDLPGRIFRAIVGLPGMLHDLFLSIWRDTTTIVSNLVTDVVNFLLALPGRVGSALTGLASALAQPFKSAVNAVLDVLDSLYSGFSTIIHKFPGGNVFPESLNLRRSYGFHAGGVVPGSGDGDRVPLLAEPGEVVLSRKAVAAMGGPRIANAWNLGVQRFGIGGIVSGIADAASSAWQDALGLGKDVLRFLSDPTGWLTNVINNSELGRLSGDFGDALRSLPGSVMNAAVEKAKDIVDLAKKAATGIGGILGSAFHGVQGLFGGDTNSGGGNLGDWINRGIALAGVPQSWAGPLRTLIMRESGGNPNSINNWDINAQRGDPSRGLMQTIGSTFERYRLPSLPDNIFDPIANIVAGIRYILAVYGSIFNVQQANASLPPRGYDIGGIITSPQIAALHANEVVIPLSRPGRAAQLADESGLTAMLGARNSANGTVINAPITVTAPNADPELVAWRVTNQIARMARSGIGG